MILKILLCFVIGYVLGNLQTGIILSKMMGRDIRKEGSHNPGTTNMLRVMGKGAGAATLLLDWGKAVLAILIARWITGGYCDLYDMAAALGVIIGHNWPAAFGFKGGKGVACTAAVITLIFPGAGGIAGLLWMITVFLCRYVSLGSLVMVSAYALIVIFTRPFWPAIPFALVVAGLCFIRHHENIGRLMRGEERRLGTKEK